MQQSWWWRKRSHHSMQHMWKLVCWLRSISAFTSPYSHTPETGGKYSIVSLVLIGFIELCESVKLIDLIGNLQTYYWFPPLQITFWLTLWTNPKVFLSLHNHLTFWTLRRVIVLVTIWNSGSCSCIFTIYGEALNALAEGTCADFTLKSCRQNKNVLCWRLKSFRMWLYLAAWPVPDILKNHSDFIQDQAVQADSTVSHSRRLESSAALVRTAYVTWSLLFVNQNVVCYFISMYIINIWILHVDFLFTVTLYLQWTIPSILIYSL
jgi:hypothetical protein